jgi:hypothetical protein
MTNKLNIVAAVALLALSATLSPLASAAPPGDLGRSFLYASLARVTTNNGGTGWVDTGSTSNACGFGIFGVQVIGPGLVYYDFARIVPVFQVTVLPPTVIPSTGPILSVPQPCPAFINPAPPFSPPYKIQIDSVTASVQAHFVASEDTLLCTQIPGATCSVTPSTATWTTSDCSAPGATFAPTNAKGLVGEFAAVALSSGISCNTGTYNGQLAANDSGAGALTKFLTYTGSLSTDFNVAPIDVIGDPDHDAWVLSCTAGTVTAVIPSPPSIVTHPLAASDWFLGLSLEAQQLANHVGTLAEYLGITGVPLQGLYDLNGDGGNVCGTPLGFIGDQEPVCIVNIAHQANQATSQATAVCSGTGAVCTDGAGNPVNPASTTVPFIAGSVVQCTAPLDRNFDDQPIPNTHCERVALNGVSAAAAGVVTATAQCTTNGPTTGIVALTGSADSGDTSDPSQPWNRFVCNTVDPGNNTWSVHCTVNVDQSQFS